MVAVQVSRAHRQPLPYPHPFTKALGHRAATMSKHRIPVTPPRQVRPHLYNLSGLSFPACETGGLSELGRCRESVSRQGS